MTVPAQASSPVLEVRPRSKLTLAPAALAACGVLLAFLFAAIFARWVTPQNPTNLAQLDLMDSYCPPAFLKGGSWSFPLGTDDQGRDILSGIIWGLRVSFATGLSATAFAAIVGVLAGLVAGYCGRVADVAVMRLADTQLTFPALLVALLVDGLLRAAFPRTAGDLSALGVLVFAIGISSWPHFARVVRAAALVEAGKDYILAARLVGRPAPSIMLAHILPNVLGPVLVIVPISLGGAIIAEATLSFLGVGLSPAQPSLGTLIRFGSAFLFSGEWWMCVFPGGALVLLIWSVNVLGDCAGDLLDPETPVRQALDIRDLMVEVHASRRGRVRALDRVSLSIAPGEVLGVVGESGAGKSLTGRAVTGLLPPAARIAGGEIWSDGTRIDNLPRPALRRLRGGQIGAIAQDAMSALDPLQTAGSQLAETIATHLGLGTAAARARAVDWLGQVGIPAPELRAQAYPHQLSGGMRQRVVVALALCGEPNLVIADEPTTALDVSVQAQIIGLLTQRARASGTAIMLITHDMGVIAEAADRVAVMYAGRIVEEGAVRDVLTSPAHPYTRGLIGSIPAVSQRVERLHQIDGSMPPPGAMTQGCPFAPRCPRVFDRCRIERPELMRAGPGRAACWLWDDRAGARHADDVAARA